MAMVVPADGCGVGGLRKAAGQPTACVVCGLQLDVPDAAEIADFRAHHRDPVTDP